MAASDTTTNVIDDLSGDYQLDPAHTRLGFATRHAMVTNVRGSFHDFSGAVHLDQEAPLRSRAEVSVQVASLTTGHEQRDAHLLGPDFFDVERYPTVTFQSTEISGVDDDRFRVSGDLTIKDQSRTVVFDVEYIGAAKDPYGNLRIGFEARAELSRKDWDLTWNVALETGGFLVSDKVLLEIDISAVKLTPTP